jgi:bisphosphoglycerate-independent phosphoglycerate mutase (AlkP superfamily)
VCLIIRDGWGYSEIKEGNAVLAAKTPNIDFYKKTYPWTLLECAGEPVGLPDGYQGSSEVGHLNMGAVLPVGSEIKAAFISLAFCRMKVYTHTRSIYSKLCAGHATNTPTVPSSSTLSLTDATPRLGAAWNT